MSDEELLEKFSDDGQEFAIDYLTHRDGSYWPCAVLYKEEKKDGASSDAEDTYVVHIIQRENFDDGVMPWAHNSLLRFLVNYPRSSIHLFVKPYESDQHLPDGFRHYIPLRDDMVPDNWKNLQDGTRATQTRIVPFVPSPRLRSLRAYMDGDDDEDEESSEGEVLSFCDE